MDSKIQINEYNPDYQSEIASLISQIQQEEYNISINLDDQPDLFSIDSVYQTGKGNFWVALYEGAVVGTIALLDIGNNQLALKKLFVKKEYRGKTFGTSKLLLQTVLDWAREKSVEEIILGTTAEFKAAHRFYEKNGFVAIEESELPAAFPKLKVDTRFYEYVLPKRLLRQPF